MASSRSRGRMFAQGYSTSQTTLFGEGRGGQGSGWWNESRRHQEAALKGMRQPTVPLLPPPRPPRQPKVERCAICDHPGGKYLIHEGPYRGSLKCESCALNQPTLAKDHVIRLGPPSISTDEAQGGPPSSPASPWADLPPLQPGQKYQVVSVGKTGWPDQSISRTSDPAKAIASAKDFQAFLDKIGEGDRVEIVPAKSMDEVREIHRNRGKSDYSVSGDDLQGVKAMGLKWDYLSKSYRGKLSPLQVEDLQARGLTVEPSSAFTYEEQREARIAKAERKAERYQGWAESAQERGESRLKAAHDLADMIPLGQPILVGHHSEAHARRDAERIDTNMRRGLEELKKADSLERRAEGSLRQAHRTKGEAEANYQARRDQVRPLLKPGMKVSWAMNPQNELTIIKVNQKTARVRSSSGSEWAEDLLYLRPKEA